MPLFCSEIYEQRTENRNQEPNNTRPATSAEGRLTMVRSFSSGWS